VGSEWTVDMILLPSVKQVDELRRTFMMVLRGHIGTLYKWGGDDIHGIDCSGLVVEGLKSVGILDAHEDYTADGLYNKFKHCPVLYPSEGCLIFYRRTPESKYHHVVIAVDDYSAIGAEGGGNTIDTSGEAIAADAYVKVRPIKRGYLMTAVDPFISCFKEE